MILKQQFRTYSRLAQEFKIDTNSLSDQAKRYHIPPYRTREQHIEDLADPSNEFDIFVVGGGATGAGLALEGSTRGLKVGLVECNDFAAGTSSRSTKMAHCNLLALEQMG